jgi:endonuclease/exonuclease/phosphatase family metal-dependent hydrolase
MKNLYFFFMILYLVVISGPLTGQSSVFLTFNIRFDNPGDGENNWHHRKQNVVELISHYDASIVGTQEGLNHQVEYIDSCLSDFTYIGVGRDDGISKGEYCAIFFDSTILKVINEGTFWLSETPGVVSVGWDASMERICTYGLFEHHCSGQKLWVFNTHFDHIGPEARANSARLILEKIEETNTNNLPVVLMGDFNATPDDKPIKILVKGITDALTISEKPFYGPIGTFNGFTDDIMTRRIDYIFVNNLDVLSYTHIDDRRKNNLHVSDHLAVMIIARF